MYLNTACDNIKREKDIGQALKEKYKKRRKKYSAQIIHHTGSHVVGKDWFKDTPRRLKIKEDGMRAEKLTSDVMYI